MLRTRAKLATDPPPSPTLPAPPLLPPSTATPSAISHSRAVVGTYFEAVSRQRAKRFILGSRRQRADEPSRRCSCGPKVSNMGLQVRSGWKLGQPHQVPRAWTAASTKDPLFGEGSGGQVSWRKGRRPSQPFGRRRRRRMQCRSGEGHP